MSDLRMVFKLECNCGHISKIDSDKCDKYICPKCGAIVFEKVNDAHEKGKVKNDLDRKESVRPIG